MLSHMIADTGTLCLFSFILDINCLVCFETKCDLDKLCNNKYALHRILCRNLDLTRNRHRLLDLT